MINRYEIGDLVQVTGPFIVTKTGQPVDPAVVMFSWIDPAGTETTLTYGVDEAVKKDEVGLYHCDISANLSGRWFWRWHSTGIGQAAGEGEFYVKPSLFAP